MTMYLTRTDVFVDVMQVLFSARINYIIMCIRMPFLHHVMPADSTFSVSGFSLVTTKQQAVSL